LMAMGRTPQYHQGKEFGQVASFPIDRRQP